MQLTTLFVLFASILSVLAQTTPTQSEVEAALQLPSGFNRFAVHKARGKAYYICAITEGTNTTSWVRTKLEAKLYTVRRKTLLGSYSTNLTIGQHTWTHTPTGSQVNGRWVRRTSQFANAFDINYALFQTTSLVPGSPTDYFAGTEYVIRANTKNGLVNNARCDAKKVGRIRDQRFTAQFWYYRPASA
ncbi:hypothetical protein BC831DRAFT_470391 [Entophlyctis helioformis]|nr:hypothetical protein BC831DRAFT_470391 [Entophlyctis helioformis]